MHNSTNRYVKAVNDKTRRRQKFTGIKSIVFGLFVTKEQILMIENKFHLCVETLLFNLAK